MILFLKRLFCRHEFNLEELKLTGIKELEKPAINASFDEWSIYYNSLSGHPSHARRVEWPCAKCRKVFYAHCGLDILSKHNQKL